VKTRESQGILIQLIVWKVRENGGIFTVYWKVRKTKMSGNYLSEHVGLLLAVVFL